MCESLHLHRVRGAQQAIPELVPDAAGAWEGPDRLIQPLCMCFGLAHSIIYCLWGVMHFRHSLLDVHGKVRAEV